MHVDQVNKFANVCHYESPISKVTVILVNNVNAAAEVKQLRSRRTIASAVTFMINWYNSNAMFVQRTSKSLISAYEILSSVPFPYIKKPTTVFTKSM